MTSRSSVVQFNEEEEISPELQFHDFSHDEIATLKPSESFTGYSESSNFNEEAEGLLSEEKEKKPSSFWDFSYYQSFFNVDTDQVFQRILWSMIPFPGRATYLDRKIRPTPDLYDFLKAILLDVITVSTHDPYIRVYKLCDEMTLRNTFILFHVVGPFWISTTLVFTTAISANIASFLMTEGQNNKIWHYDFHKVSLAATAIYSYAFLLPVIIWALMWYRQSSTKYTLLEILCVYGYSLFIYIPISVLWVIQVSWFQWLLVLLGATLSGLVLIQTFLPAVKNENKKITMVVLSLIMLFHVLLAVGFMAYFFQPPHPANSHIIVPSDTTGLLTVTTEHKAEYASQQNNSVDSVPDHITKKRDSSKLVLKQNSDTKHTTIINPLINNINISETKTSHF